MAGRLDGRDVPVGDRRLGVGAVVLGGGAARERPQGRAQCDGGGEGDGGFGAGAWEGAWHGFPSW